MVSLFAKHYETREVIPDKMLHKLCVSKNIFASSELQSQVFYSMLDQAYHSDKINVPTTQILEEIQSKYYNLPYIKNTVSVKL